MAQQDRNGERAHGRFDHLHAAPGLILEAGNKAVGLGGVEQVGLVHDNHISAGHLVFKQLGQGCFVIKVFVQLALCVHGCDGMRELPIGHGAAIHDRDNAVHGDTGRNAGPVKGAHKGLGQGKARRFDHNVIRGRVTIQQFFHRWDEVIGHGATNAAVRQFHHVVLGAGLDAATLKDIAIDA